MEDTHLISLLKDEPSFIACVFDGHGGDQVAHFCKASFKEILQQALHSCNNDVAVALRSAFASADALVKHINISETVGSTALVSVITKERVWFANAGDSMTMGSVNGAPVLFSVEHKVEHEKERIIAEGGYITYWDGVARVNGTLNVARAIGDHYIKKHVNSTPFVRSCKSADLDYILLASDGVWDVLKTKELFTIIQRAREYDMADYAKIAAEQIVKYAVDRGSTDNITVVIVPLDQIFPR